MQASFTKVVEAARAGDGKLAISLVNGEATQRISSLTKLLEQMADMQREFASSAIADSSALFGSTRQLILATIAGAIILALVTGLVMTRSVTRPLHEAVAGASAIAAGDLSREFKKDGRDEVSQLIGQMDIMRERIRSVIDAQVELAAQHEAGNTSYRIDSAQLPGVYGDLATRVNELAAAHIEVTSKLVDVLGKYATGDLSVDMPELPAEQAALTRAAADAKRALQAIDGEIRSLVGAAAAGDFSQRGLAENHQYTFREMIEGLNQLMQTCERGLQDVSTVMGHIARGDLTARMEGDREGAFARIQADCNSTADHLTGLVRDIQQAALTIDTAANEIAEGNADLAKRTEEQAASLEETAASMEELTSTVKLNADNAGHANELAVSASSVAARGGKVVGEVVGTMSAISASSRKIADIIGVIDGIAFQTNILALNAAVEAARAGEQGRGFAVVATEVRNLAQRSANAAREIKTLIEESTGNVDAGSRLVAGAGATMDEVVDSVRRMTDIMAHISSASSEQSAGIEQVNQAVSEMDKATQKNATVVEKAAAASQSLKQEVHNLSNAVAAFKLPQA